MTRNELIRDVAWSYEAPPDGAARIAGYIAFDARRVAVEEVWAHQGGGRPPGEEGPGGVAGLSHPSKVKAGRGVIVDGESKQDRNQRIILSGEFQVAGELLHRGITAEVTYENAKKAESCRTGRLAIAIEVKTTQG